MFGNCATGRLVMVMPPTMTIRIEITMATMGRSMKNLDMLAYLCLKPSGLGDNNGPFFQLSDSLHNDVVIRLQAVIDDPIRPHLFADLHRANGGLVVGAYDRNLIPALKF